MVNFRDIKVFKQDILTFLSINMNKHVLIKEVKGTFISVSVCNRRRDV